MRGLLPVGLTLLVALAPLDAALARHATLVHAFTGSDGADAQAPVIRDDSGNLYGTTMRGGAAGYGTVFKLAPDGTYTLLHSFTGVDGDQTPLARLLRDGHGNLYGTAYGGNSNGTVFRVSPGGQETLLHKFSSADVAGYDPASGLIADTDGNLYGTTTQGGAYGGGTAYRLAADGTIAVLHAFGMVPDGWGPVGGLTADDAGNLYGTTALGGAQNCRGIVFRIAPNGSETILHAFSEENEGFEPWGGVIRDAQGNLYGETLNGTGGSQSGSVYKLAPDGTYTTLYMFHGFGDGAQPIGELVADAHGNLYGTTSSGGMTNGGTVFRLSPEGTLKTLYIFNSATRSFHAGFQPYAGLTIDRDGNLYGTTSYGGRRLQHAGQGTVFEIDAK